MPGWAVVPSLPCGVRVDARVRTKRADARVRTDRVDARVRTDRVDAGGRRCFRALTWWCAQWCTVDGDPLLEQ